MGAAARCTHVARLVFSAGIRARALRHHHDVFSRCPGSICVNVFGGVRWMIAPRCCRSFPLYDAADRRGQQHDSVA
jgi:hypothetical protein